MASQYIFIVGLPRTGTKLMMNILENCQEKQCFITPENFYLGRFLRSGIKESMKEVGVLSNDANVRMLVNRIYGGNYSVFKGDYWYCAANGELGFSKEEMVTAILASDRTERSVYQILLEAYGNGSPDAILGDKTGPHLYRIPTLLEWFPDAKIVQTFRDPRAILASEHKKQLAKLNRQINNSQGGLEGILLRAKRFFLSPMIVFYITIAWIAAARLDRKYQKQYPNNYYLSRFENLVADPEPSVKKLCGFLNIQFHQAMLNPPKVDSSFAPKDKGGTGFNTQTLSSWQAYLTPWMKAWLLIWGRKYLKAFDYI